MKVLKSIGIAVAVVSGGVFSQGALAACSYIGGQDDITVSSPAVTIDPDLPINSVLGTITMRSSVTTMANCNPPGMKLSLTSGYEPGPDNLYYIGIAGVAMTITLGEDERGHYTSSGVAALLTDQSPGNQLYSWAPEITLQLVKIGNITSGGSIPSDHRLVRALGINTSDSFTFFDAYLATPLEIKVLQPTCSAASTNPNVSLDPISTADFDPSGRAKPTDFNIDLSCTGGVGTTDVSATLTDANSPGNTGATLTPASGSDAEGVVLEVHKGSGSNSPVQFGSKWLAIQGAQQGSYQIPLSVNYLKNGPLKSGEVKAGMTYTLDYE